MGKEGKVVGGCPLCKNKQTNKNNRIDCTELSLKNSHTQIENLWVKFGYQDNKENFLVGIYHTLPDQEKDVDEEFFLQPQEASCLHTVIMLRASTTQMSSGKTAQQKINSPANYWIFLG